MYVQCAYMYFDAFVSIITVRLSLKLYLILSFVLILILIISSLAEWRTWLMYMCSACVRMKL